MLTGGKLPSVCRNGVIVDLVRDEGFPLSAKSAAADCFGWSGFARKAFLAANSLSMK
jgi:hypothetical protein